LSVFITREDNRSRDTDPVAPFPNIKFTVMFTSFMALMCLVVHGYSNDMTNSSEVDWFSVCESIHADDDVPTTALCIKYCYMGECQYESTNNTWCVDLRVETNNTNSTPSIIFPCDPDCGSGGVYDPQEGPLQCVCGTDAHLHQNAIDPLSEKTQSVCVHTVVNGYETKTALPIGNLLCGLLTFFLLSTGWAYFE
jgi:hypothetical protein